MKWKMKPHDFLASKLTTTRIKMRQIDGGLCTTSEKWFASGEYNVFRLSREDVFGLSEIMMTSGRSLGGKDFLVAAKPFFKDLEKW